MEVCEDKKNTTPTTVAEGCEWIIDTCDGALSIQDGEWDDIALRRHLWDKNKVYPAFNITVTTPGKDREALVLKLQMSYLWLGDSWTPYGDLVMDMAERPDKELLQRIKTHCVHNGRLRVLTTAPSGTILQACLDDPQLGAIPWDVVTYTGTYNVITGEKNGLPTLLDVLAKKMNRQDGSVMFNGNWWVAMGRDKMDKRLKDLSTLFNDADWQMLRDIYGDLVRAVERFMCVFNAGLIQPDKLFNDGEDGAEIAPPEVLQEAVAQRQKGMSEYVRWCKTPEAIKWVKNKKKNILLSLEHNAPMADYVIALATEADMQPFWEIKTGVLQAKLDSKPKVLDTAPAVDVPINCFHFELKPVAADKVYETVHASVMSCMSTL